MENLIGKASPKTYLLGRDNLIIQTISFDLKDIDQKTFPLVLELYFENIDLKNKKEAHKQKVTKNYEKLFPKNIKHTRIL